jgi:hypothetical protein
MYENEVLVLPTSDVTYSLAPYDAIDDGFRMYAPMLPVTVLKSFAVTNGPQEQYDAMQPVVYAFDQGSISNVLQGLPTTVELHIKPATGGPFTTPLSVTIADLVIPKQIDLEAPSNA